MTIKPSERGQVLPFIVMDVMKAASGLELSGHKVIHLEVGQPSTGIPQAAINSVKSLIGESPLGYTVAHGIPELRARISSYYRDRYAVDVPKESVFITTGSSAGFQLAFLAAFDVGDRVALASPGYPAYRQILSSLGLEPVLLPAGPDTRFQPSIDMLAALTKPIDGLILASPSNPTGTIIPKAEFNSLISYCREHGIRLISDEIYHGITYGQAPETAAGSGGSEIVVNSFSKYFCMTGWRVGWMIIPPDLTRSIECLAQNHYISPPTISQWAALHVFEAKEELDANVSRYTENRSVLLRGLPNAGIDKLAPSDGAFYLYADVGDLTDDSVAFCHTLLTEAGVAVTPGIDFDPDRGRQTLRISFAGTTEDMHEAVKRIGDWRSK